MKKCIFCNKTETEFIGDNCWSVEHIIPESLGNNSMKINNVCKSCNSALGTYVDSYFLNNRLVEIIRQQHGIKSKKGEIPNAFKNGVDNDGNIIRVDNQFHLSMVPFIKQEGNKLHIKANSRKELEQIIKKKIKRMNLTAEQEQQVLQAINEAKSYSERPEINYDLTIEINRLFLEAMKIAYEYAFLKFGYEYIEDEVAIVNRKCLNEAINGNMKVKCENIPNVCIAPEEIVEIFHNIPQSHILFIHPDKENKMIAEVLLFCEKLLSFSVLLSYNTRKYFFDNDNFFDIITY